MLSVCDKRGGEGPQGLLCSFPAPAAVPAVLGSRGAPGLPYPNPQLLHQTLFNLALKSPLLNIVTRNDLSVLPEQPLLLFGGTTFTPGVILDTIPAFPYLALSFFSLKPALSRLTALCPWRKETSSSELLGFVADFGTVFHPASCSNSN